MAIEDTMAQMAHSQITQSLPSMTEDIQGFQIIDTNDEINSAIGVIVGLVGNMVVYVPAIYRRGKIYNMDIMYIPEIRQWLPTHDNWLTYIRSRRADLEAVIKDRDQVSRGGKAANISLDEPLLQIVKTASSKLDEEYIKSVGIRKALKDAEDVLVNQLTTPAASLELPEATDLIRKCAASATAQNLVQALADHTVVGDALVQFYSDDDLSNMAEDVVRALTVETKVAPSAKQQGSVKLLTSASVEARDLSDEDKATILRDGAVISDTRGLTPTKVYKTRSNGSWVSPGTSGLYELLKLDGKTVTAYVVCGSRRHNVGEDGVCGENYVIPMDDGMSRVAIEVPAHILGQPIPVTDINLSGGSKLEDLPSNRWFEKLLVDANGTALRINACGAHHIGDKGDYIVKLDSGRAHAVGVWQDKSFGQYEHITNLVEVPASGNLRIYGKTLYVPASARFFEIQPDRDVSYPTVVCDCEGVEPSDVKPTRALNLATFDEYIDAVKRRNKLVSVKIYNDPTGYVITSDKDRPDVMGDPLAKTAAAVKLVKDFAVEPSVAFGMLDEVKSNESSRYLMKIAAGTNYEMVFNDFDPSEEEAVSVDLNNEASANAKSREEMIAELDKAGKSGVKEVMDVTVLRMLADDGSCVRLIQDMVPSLFTAMNTVGQLLFMLRAGTSMSEAYGDFRADEMEKQFTKLMQRLGDAVIVLQQGRVGSVKDLLEGPLSDTLG